MDPSTKEPTSGGNEVQRQRGVASVLEKGLVLGPSSPRWAGLHEDGMKAPSTPPSGPPAEPAGGPTVSSSGLSCFPCRRNPLPPPFLISTRSAEAAGCSPHSLSLGRAPGHLRALGCDPRTKPGRPGSCWIRGSSSLHWVRTCVPGTSLLLQQNWPGQRVFQTAPPRSCLLGALGEGGGFRSQT